VAVDNHCLVRPSNIHDKEGYSESYAVQERNACAGFVVEGPQEWNKSYPRQKIDTDRGKGQREKKTAAGCRSKGNEADQSSWKGTTIGQWKAWRRCGLYRSLFFGRVCVQ
jgi:hypothetical protein